MMPRYLFVISTLALLLFASTALCSSKADMYYQNAIQLQGASNLEEIFTLYARSAELGHPVAQYNLAMMYSNGESVYVDYQQAVYWFRKSASQEFAPAQYRLGEMYYFEKGGLTRDLGMAVKMFEKAAKQQDPDALMNLAMLSATGEGIPQDMQKAIIWMEQAQAGGNALAEQYLLKLKESQDVTFSTQQINRYWIEKAAELGIREAQEELRLLETQS